MLLHQLSVFSLLFIITSSGDAAECIPTPHRTTGSHYEPVTVQKVNVSKGIIVSGQVLAAPDCKPVANAKVAHWQAGEDGRYSDKLRAYMVSDATGHYRFETEWPDLNPPHIHFIISAEGFNRLETQWVGGKRQRQRHIGFDIVLEPR